MKEGIVAVSLSITRSQLPGTPPLTKPCPLIWFPEEAGVPRVGEQGYHGMVASTSLVQGSQILSALKMF